MSVLIVTPDVVGPVKNGGIGTACFHYARTLANAAIPVGILFTGVIDNGSADHWRAWYAELGIEFLTVDDLPPQQHTIYGLRWHGERSLRIYRFLETATYRYVLFQDWHANAFWSVRAKRMGVALATTTLGVITHSPNEWQKAGMGEFGHHPLEESSLEWEEKESIAAADIVVSPSRHMVAWLRDNGYTLPPRVEICPYTFEDPIQGLRADTVDRDHLIFFGRIETRKGAHLLGGALRTLKQRGMKLPRKVSFLGKYANVQGMPSESYLNALADELPETEFFIKTDYDYRNAVEYIREQNGIVVIASTLDNFPLTVMESIANGLCFIASTAGGIPEMVDPATSFEPTVAALADKLVSVDAIPFAEVKHKYDPDRARETWLSHVKGILAAPFPTPAIRDGQDNGVSVCVPFYHFDRYMPRLISALLRETELHGNLQIVVVNDGTPEKDCPEFHRFRRSLEPIGHVFHVQENQGAGAARNKAAELARHDRIIFFDADNVPFEGMAAKLVRALDASAADSIAAPFSAIPAFTRQPMATDIWYYFHPAGGPLSTSMLDNCLGDTCGIQKRSTFEKVGGFSLNRNYYDDWEYMIKLIGQGHRHWVYPETLFYYAHDPDGRRTWQSEYEKREHLWNGLSAVAPAQLHEILKIFIKQQHVAKR